MATDVSMSESEMCEVPLTHDTAVTKDDSPLPEPSSAMYAFSRQAIRSNYMDKSIEAKKKVRRHRYYLFEYIYGKVF